MTKLSTEARDTSEPQQAARGGRQLSLFDFVPVLRLVCFPMHDLHGETFKRKLLEMRPMVVADLRSYPYFNLRGLGVAAAFRSFDYLDAKYVHLPMRISEQAGYSRWQDRQSFQYLVEVLFNFRVENHRPMALLVDNFYEVSLLQDLSRGLKYRDYEIQVASFPL